MKIHTNYVSIELSIEEFENILEKDILEKILNVVIEISDDMSQKEEVGIVYLLEDMIGMGDMEMEESFDGLYFYEEFCDEEETEEDELIVNRIYRKIIKSGEKGWKKE